MADYRYDLPVPGRIEVPGTEWAVSAEVARGSRRLSGSDGRPTVHIDGAAAAAGPCGEELAPGRLAAAPWIGRPKEASGRLCRSGSCLARARRRLPLVVDAQDQVVWVPGLALDDAARVTADTKAVVVLTMFQVGGPA